VLKSLSDMEKLIVPGVRAPIAVAGAESASVLLAVEQAQKRGLVDPLLVGNTEKIQAAAHSAQLDIDSMKIIPADEQTESAYIAVSLVNQGKAKCLMKGTVETALLLKTYLSKEFSLRGEGLLSHVTVFEIPSYKKLLFLTDGALNPAPTLENKVEIIKNCASVARTLGYKLIKVAALSFAEKDDRKTASLSEAAALKKMYLDRGFDEDVIVEGPISFDLAVSEQSALNKGFVSTVAGDADILLLHNLETANALGKSFTYFGQAKSAGIVVGHKAPLILLSRSDSQSMKYYSIVLGVLQYWNK